MQLTHPFVLTLDVQCTSDRAPYPDPGIREAVPLPGLPDWTIWPSEAQPGWVHFTLHSPALTGEEGLTELLVVLDFLNETGPADLQFSKVSVHVLPDDLTPFQLEMLAVVTEAYRPVLTAFHGAEVRAWAVNFMHNFQLVGLVHLPLVPDEAVTFGAVLFSLGLLEYGLGTEAPSLPAPATSRHQALEHLANVLEASQEVRAELLPALRRQVLQAAVTLGELSPTWARRLRC